MKGKLNWRPQEDIVIKCLRDQGKIKNWKKIAKIINYQFSDIQRSGKQCRQRYVNTARFSEEIEQDKSWSQKEQQLLSQLYLEYGAKWTLFTKDFPNRSENSIKNRFYCCLRKVITKFRESEGKNSSPTKNVIKLSMIIAILQIVKRVQKQAMAIAGIQINYEWNIFMLRKHILDLAFGNRDFEQQQVKEIVKMVHKTSYRFKCLGISKKNNKTKWEMNKKRLFYILGFQSDANLSKIQMDQCPPTQQNIMSLNKQKVEMINFVKLQE